MEKIEKALNILTNKGNYFTEWMGKPFNIGGDVYSTNSRSIMKVPNNSVRVFDELNKKEPVKEIIKYFDFKGSKIMDVKLSNLKDAVSKVPLIDEITEDHIDCVECDGDGEVEWIYESYIKEMDCPACDGDGYKIKETTTGGKVKAEGYFIDIKHNRLPTAMIDQLIIISELLEVDNIEIISQNKTEKVIVFKVGIAEIIMMPSLLSNEQNVINSFYQ